MNNIITVEEYLKDLQFEYENTGEYKMYFACDISKKMIEFAKMHVEAALKVASENSNELLCGKSKKKDGKFQGSCGKWCGACDHPIVDKYSILNAYDLNQIK